MALKERNVGIKGLTIKSLSKIMKFIMSRITRSNCSEKRTFKQKLH